MKNKKESKNHNKMNHKESGSLGGKKLVEKYGNDFLKKIGRDTTFKKGHKSGMTGKSHSHETCEKIKKANTGRKYPTNSGSKHPAWKGGITAEGYPVEFNKELKEKIRYRDNNTCQLCGMTKKESLDYYGVNLSVNHIDYNKLNCDEKNLNTLCNYCNSLVNWDREFFTRLFRAKLEGKEGDINKNIFLIVSLKHFCRRNPSLRFWQALRDWAGLDYILSMGKKEVGTTDTYHWTEKNK